ncbi:condensation domain-containing protein [Silvibacterium dinghuense]|uniref:Carrier domain-containing protein n=1 Tax=Silvibacterium dinghuense TaxID=1560006 RepID=A0A4Q1SHB8_9BACT|nr:condensation domain-containing protein [Silvibacterium dinghuense]RXS96755.1 hypothetical protein ESZ00_02050 [Silvibacterium dinghuense]GGG93377.1 hypothetical protein GCM10011586_05160 [Silvibacterium dinghuense]
MAEMISTERETDIRQGEKGMEPSGTETEVFEASEDVYVFPASLEQHRYWILDQVDPESTASNMAIAFRLEGQVDDAIAEQAIRELTARHEALRTTFRMVHGDLLQVIAEQPKFSFQIDDLRNLPEHRRMAAAEQSILAHSHVRIDLAAGPVFLTRLVHVSDTQHFLAFTMHHSVCDGWSNGVLVRDFAEFYAALSAGRAPELNDLPFQFADFTEWQKGWLETEDAEKALVFWKEQIRRNVPALDLPTDFPRSAHKDGPGHIESELISPELNARIKTFCRNHDATMHQVLLATLEGLLARYTGQDAFLLGSSIANRTQPGMEDVVGRFANPQVILASVEQNPTFKELLDRVIVWSGEAYAHQDLPFSRIMEEFQLELTGATSQFLQVYFVYQRAFMQPHQAGEGLKIIPRPSVSGGVNFDMLVSVVERAEGPRVQIEYNTDLFTPERVRRFIAAFIRCIDAVCTDSSLRVSALPLLAPQHEIALVETSRSYAQTAPAASSLTEHFDRLAVSLADAVAISTGLQSTSWKALHAESLRLAAALAARGITQGQTVALRMEASAEAAAAALAILRIRASVLPVPATATTEEWNRILAELEPAAALASASFARTVNQTLSIEQLRKASAPHTSLPNPEPGDAAVCILDIGSNEHYQVTTSTHARVLEQCSAAATRLDLETESLVGVVPSDTAVGSWSDLMLPLLRGAGIRYLAAGDAPALGRSITGTPLQAVIASPSVWLRLQHSGWKAPQGLQIISRGGRLPQSVATEIATLGRTWSLLSSAHAGGPLGLAPLSPDTLDTSWPVAPLPGNELSVRDRFGKQAIEGVHGELCFRQSSDSDWTGTGYTAQFQNGGIAVIGAATRTIRISGYRVHLGELEDRLMELPDVSAARASVQNGPHGAPELVTYLAGFDGKEPDRERAATHLRATAPQHLSRTEIVSVPEIFCRPDGSPNLALLPRPDRTLSNRSACESFVPPADELEAKLVAIWEEVLGVPNIGTRTSFFSLGGYSLMIVRLFARINKGFGTSLPITTIFNAPTVEQLAEILRGRKAYSALVPVQTTGNRPPFFLIHSYLLYAGLPSVMGREYPFYGLRELDNEGQITMEQRVRSYAEAIRAVQPEGPYFIGGWCAAGPLTVEVARHLMAAGQQVAFMVLFDSWRPGYAEELAAQQATEGRAGWLTRQRWKYAYHASRMRKLPRNQRAQYLWNASTHKLKGMRDTLYLRHWATMRWLSQQFDFRLPDFMHNISLDTLNAVAKYKAEPFPCRMTLMRATESQVVPGADPTCGWSQIVAGGVEVVWAPGNHESMFREPNLSIVGRMLVERIEKAAQNQA